MTTPTTAEPMDWRDVEQMAYDRGYADGEAAARAEADAEIGRLRDNVSVLGSHMVELREARAEAVKEWRESLGGMLVMHDDDCADCRDARALLATPERILAE